MSTGNALDAPAEGALKLYTADEAAAKLGIREIRASWLRVQARKGNIPSGKIGNRRRFTDEDLAAIVDALKRRKETP